MIEILYRDGIYDDDKFYHLCCLIWTLLMWCYFMILVLIQNKLCIKMIREGATFEGWQGCITKLYICSFHVRISFRSFVWHATTVIRRIHRTQNSFLTWKSLIIAFYKHINVYSLLTLIFTTRLCDLQIFAHIIKI